MQQNPDDSFNVWKKPQLWCWSKVMLGDKLIVANIGGGDTAQYIFIFAFYISLPDKSIKQAINAKLNSLLPKGTRNCDA